MNNVFDIRRFGLMLRYEFVTNIKFYTHTFLGVAIGLFLILEINMITAYMRGDVDAVSSKMDSNAGGYLALLFMLAITGSSFVCSTIKQKNKAIDFFMLPVSNFEKFLSRYLLSTVGLIVLAVCDIALADVLNMLTAVVFGMDSYSSLIMNCVTIIAKVCDEVISEAAVTDRGWMFIAYGFMMLLSCHAFFLLCGVIFRRRQWLLGVLLAMVIAYLFESVNIDIASGIRCVASGSFIAASCLLLGFVVFVVVMYWLSYRLFCRTQIAGRKWVNL